MTIEPGHHYTHVSNRQICMQNRALVMLYSHLHALVVVFIPSIHGMFRQVGPRHDSHSQSFQTGFVPLHLNLH
jgi:hypothetical protein